MLRARHVGKGVPSTGGSGTAGSMQGGPNMRSGEILRGDGEQEGLVAGRGGEGGCGIHGFLSSMQ